MYAGTNQYSSINCNEAIWFVASADIINLSIEVVSVETQGRL